MATSTQRQAAIGFINAFNTLDIEQSISLRSADCIHDMGPASIGMKKGTTNEAYREYAANLKTVVAGFEMSIHEIIEAPGQVTVWASSEAKFQSEAVDEDGGWEYHGEYLFVLWFDQTGKISRVIEFLDSNNAAKALSLVARGRENLAKRARKV